MPVRRAALAFSAPLLLLGVAVSAWVAVALAGDRDGGAGAAEAGAPAEKAGAGGGTRTGALVAVGGGRIGDDVLARVLAISGGADGAVVLVVPQASAAEDAGEAASALWRGAGATRVEVLDLEPGRREAAEGAIARATFIWLAGGDQNRLVRALDEAGLAVSFRKRCAAGATVGGTSAGAAALSVVMLTGEADLERIVVGGTETAAGLALWPEAIVDQHVLRRGRLPRLIAAVLDHRDRVGVGIDESTAVIVSPDGSFEVVGESSVVVIDARAAARVEAAGARAAGAPAAVAGATLHVLTEGMRFDPR